jgi:multiple sugar transport system permease protein
MMPLVKPGLVSFAIFTFMYYWNDYFRPLIFISSQEKMTLPLGLAFLKGYMGLGSDAWLLAAISIAVIPLIIVFLFAQRSFIEGITMTGLKEG